MDKIAKLLKRQRARAGLASMDDLHALPDRHRLILGDLNEVADEIEPASINEHVKITKKRHGGNRNSVQ